MLGRTEKGRGLSLLRQKVARPSQSWAVLGVEPAGSPVEMAVRLKGSELRLEWVPWRGVIPPSQALCSLACLPLLPSFPRLQGQQAEQLWCETSPHPTPATLPVAVWFGATERKLQHSQFEYTSDPNITSAGPTKSFLRCWVKGTLHGMWEGGPSRSRTRGMCRALCGGCDSHAGGEKSHVALGWGGATPAGTGLCLKAWISKP